MKLRKLVAFVFLFSCALEPLAAQEVFISNRPFKGAVQRSGASTLVELEPFVAALGLELREADGCLHVLRPGEAPSPCGSGPCGVFLGDKRLESASLDGSPRMVGLEELSGALNARVVKNASLGTIDVYRPPGAQAGEQEQGYLLLGFGTAGDLSTLQSNLAGFSGAQLALVDVADRDSQAFQQYGQYFEMGALPYAVLVDPSGRVIESWNGYPTTKEVEKVYQGYLSQKQRINRKPVATKSTKAKVSGKGGSGGG